MDTMTLLAAIGVALLALLVGAAIPVLFQMRKTLKSAQLFIDDTSPKVDVAIMQVAALTSRLNHVVDQVETSLPQVHRVLDATNGLADSVTQVRNSLKAVSAFGPAAFAAGKALVSSFLTRSAPPPNQESDIAALARAEAEGMTAPATVS